MKKHVKIKFLALSAMLLISSLSWGQIPNYVPTNGLVGWWPFNGNANDESGNGNNGTVNGAVLSADRFGTINSAYSFDGISDFINCGNSNSVNISGDLTISGWIYANNFNIDHGIVSKSGLYDLITSAPFTQPPLDKIRFEADNAPFLFTNSISSNQWLHIVAVYSTINGKSIYLNGILIASDPQVGVITPNNTYNLYLGAHQPFIVNNWSWDGKLDDIGIWNRALSACEVAALYSGQLVNPPTVDLGNDTLNVCGISTTLDATNTAAGNYSWNTGATSPTLEVTNTGTYFVTVTDTSGCSATDSIYVSVIDPTITAQETAFCLGDSTVLSVQSSGNSCGALSGTLQNGLVGWWPFCGNANDESGNGYDGEFVNEVNGLIYSSDRFGNINSSIEFNSLNIGNQLLAPYVNITNSSSVVFDQEYSFSVWSKIGINTQVAELINRGPDNNSFFSRFQGLNGFAFGNYPDYFNNTMIIDTTQWHMYTYIRTNSGNGQLYYDGLLIETQQIAAISNFGNNFAFGKMPSGGTNGSYYPYQGKLDDIGIWNRALTQQEIQDLYNQGNLSTWWSDGTTNQNSIQVQPTQTTTYSVTVSDGVGTCTDSITIQVNNPQVNAGSDLSVCEGETATLTATGADTYAWDNGVVNGQPFTPTVDGYYTVTGTDTLGCSNTVSVFLDVLQPTSSTITPLSCDTYTAPDNEVYTNSGQYTAIIPNAAGCDSTITINLTVNNSNSGIDSKTACDSYTWIDGNTYTASTTSPTFTLQNVNGCDSVITLNLTINKLQGLNAGDDITACQGDNITLAASGATTYSWTGGAANGVAFVPPSGTTIYTVTGTDDNGCTATDAVSVLVEYCLDIPGGISPNGDNANDTWTITGLDQYPDAKVFVFDRWGQKVFSGDAANATWDGTYEGKELPTADYYYIIELGNGEKFNGVVTLKK